MGGISGGEILQGDNSGGGLRRVEILVVEISGVEDARGGNRDPRHGGNTEDLYCT